MKNITLKTITVHFKTLKQISLNNKNWKCTNTQ